MIMAGSANSNDVLVFTTADNGATFMADTLDIGVLAVVHQQVHYLQENFIGMVPVKFPKNFLLMDRLVSAQFPALLLQPDPIQFVLLEQPEDYEYFISFQYGGGNENARIQGLLSYDPAQAESYSITPTLRYKFKSQWY